MKLYCAASSHQYSGEGVKTGYAVHARRALLSFTSPSFTEANLERAAQRMTPESVCLDSGAHIFFTDAFKNGDRAPLAKIETHLAAYVRAVEAFAKLRSLEFVAELDLQRLVGLDTVRAWRRDVWLPLQARTRTPVAPTWHLQDGEAAWRELLDSDFRYLAVPKSVAAEWTKQQHAGVRNAHRIGKPVHGWACVSKRYMTAMPFASVDSTSWYSPVIRGVQPVFDASKLSMRAVMYTRRMSANARAGVAAMMNMPASATSYGELAGRTAAEYEKFEDAITAFWSVRGVSWQKVFETIKSNW